MKAKNEIPKDYVKKQTLFGAVVLALVVGFIGGAVYSSVKLGAGSGAGRASSPQPQAGTKVLQNDAASLASAVMNLEQYLNNHPDDMEAWVKLGNLFFDSSQPSNAIQAYEKALELNPDQINVITDLGVMYRRNKQPQKAVEMFEKAIEINPEFETAWFNKGVVLLHDLNDKTGGIKAWEQLVKINPMAMAPGGESVDSLVQRMKKND